MPVGDVWRALTTSSFAVLSYVTPDGEPRSSGVVYVTAARRLYVAVATDSWKARHIPAIGQVAVTVPVRRGGLMSLLMPIPPATISFHARATVQPAGALTIPELARLVPPERRDECRVIEIVPEGDFVTYGIGVPLMKMLNPAESRRRVPVS
jgi:hypothetical protein